MFGRRQRNDWLCNSSPFQIGVFMKPTFLSGSLGDVCRGPTEMFGQRDVFGPVFEQDSKPVAGGRLTRFRPPSGLLG